MSVYAHYAPCRLRQSTWESMRSELLGRVVRTLDEYAPGFSRLIVFSEVITPLQLESDFGFSGGHVCHGELALDQLFMMRPAIGYGRYNSPVDGLFLSGAGTHPGGLMSGANGKLAAREVLKKGRM